MRRLTLLATLSVCLAAASICEAQQAGRAKALVLRLDNVAMRGQASAWTDYMGNAQAPIVLRRAACPGTIGSLAAELGRSAASNPLS